MLLIEQIYEPNNVQYNYLKCPACKRGRLCDKPVGEKAMAMDETDDFENPFLGKHLDRFTTEYDTYRRH